MKNRTRIIYWMVQKDRSWFNEGTFLAVQAIIPHGAGLTWQACCPPARVITVYFASPWEDGGAVPKIINKTPNSRSRLLLGLCSEKTRDVRVPLGAIPSARRGFDLQTSSSGTLLCASLAGTRESVSYSIAQLICLAYQPSHILVKWELGCSGKKHWVWCWKVGFRFWLYHCR